VAGAPPEWGAQKRRPCRYTIVGDIEAEYETAYVGLSAYEDFDAFEDDLWGEYDEPYGITW